LPSRWRPFAGAFAAVVLTATAVVPALFLAPPAQAATSASTASVEYRLPFRVGESYEVNQSWHGPYSHFGRSGYAYDFGLPQGTPVVAAAPGVVSYVQTGKTRCGGAGLRNASNYVTIDHADGTATLYAHLSRVDAVVGQRVLGGQVIGLSGKTGYTGCAAHLHFARQAQGGGVTQSKPVYFAETGHRRLRMYETVTSENPPCLQTPTAMPREAFCGEYFSGNGTATLTRIDPVVDFDWPDGGPLATSAPASDRGAGAGTKPPAELYARWVGRFTFATNGTYTFTLTAARGVRLFVDGEALLDSWDDSREPVEYAVNRTLPAGPHVIQLDYRAVGASVARLGWFRSSDGTGSPILD